MTERFPKTSINVRMGAVIRLLRTVEGLLQRELAEKSGRSISTISLYERGERGVRLDVIEDIARALDTTPVEMINLANNLYRSK